MALLKEKDILDMLGYNLANPSKPYSVQNCSNCSGTCKNEGISNGSFTPDWCPSWQQYIKK